MKFSTILVAAVSIIGAIAAPRPNPEPEVSLTIKLKGDLHERMAAADIAELINKSILEKRNVKRAECYHCGFRLCSSAPVSQCCPYVCYCKLSSLSQTFKKEAVSQKQWESLGIRKRYI
ncbi:hypothetical protein AA313_de0202225 [Arthrobotrys entomopaga]|nr:hypothetical protein AA313_de0202225 [Arthrobotrys entomopaga]